MNPNKALWEKGDFTEIAATMNTSKNAGTSIPATFMRVTVGL